jgi:hypothetical protein
MLRAKLEHEAAAAARRVDGKAERGVVEPEPTPHPWDDELTRMALAAAEEDADDTEENGTAGILDDTDRSSKRPRTSVGEDRQQPEAAANLTSDIADAAPAELVQGSEPPAAGLEPPAAGLSSFPEALDGR